MSDSFLLYTYIEDYKKVSPLPLLAAKLSRRRSNLSRSKLSLSIP